MAKIKALIHTSVIAPGDYYVTFSTDMTGYGYLFLGEHEFEFEVPPFSKMVPGAIAALKEEQSKIRAKAESDCVKLNDQIQDLLALTHEG